MAIAAMVCSLVGFACCLPALVGVVLGVVSLNQIKQTGQEGRGMALAGIIVGIVVMVGYIAYVVLIVVLAANDPSFGDPGNRSTYGS
jgi:uncharacterized membrane protein